MNRESVYYEGELVFLSIKTELSSVLEAYSFEGLPSGTPPSIITLADLPNYWNAFPKGTSIVVPAASLNAYKQAAGWSAYASSMIGG